MENEIIKEYSTEELTVIWKPKKCIHSEVCVKTIPEVYHPNDKPWIKPENASTDALKDQISKCPSGALSFKESEETETEKTNVIECNVMQNGPLLVTGPLKVTMADGSVDTKEKNAAFCRCGASSKKPYCDGSHKEIDFKG